MVKLKAIAIIPARAGSKRIPGKNIKRFLGKPIIGYPIKAVLQAKIFDEVMVSTDSSKIAKIAQALGAKVPFLRSLKNASDKATTTKVMQEVLQQYQKKGQTFDLFCCLYPTAVFVTDKILKKTFNLIKKSRADSLCPVLAYGHSIQRAFKISKNRLVRLHPQYANICTQDLKPRFHDAAQFYWVKTKKFRKMKNKNMISKNSLPFIVSNLEAQDIDNIDDWKMAEIKYRHLHGKN